VFASFFVADFVHRKFAQFGEFRKLVRKDVGMKTNEVTDEELREMFDHVDGTIEASFLGMI